jgi:hypothetical protein
MTAEPPARHPVLEEVGNLMRGFLCKYTQTFAKKHLDKDICADFTVDRAVVNYATETWASKPYVLPRLSDHRSVRSSWVRLPYMRRQPRAAHRPPTWRSKSRRHGERESPTAMRGCRRLRTSLWNAPLPTVAAATFSRPQCRSAPGYGRG